MNEIFISPICKMLSFLFFYCEKIPCLRWLWSLFWNYLGNRISNLRPDMDGGLWESPLSELHHMPCLLTISAPPTWLARVSAFFFDGRLLSKCHTTPACQGAGSAWAFMPSQQESLTNDWQVGEYEYLSSFTRRQGWFWALRFTLFFNVVPLD